MCVCVCVFDVFLYRLCTVSFVKGKCRVSLLPRKRVCVCVCARACKLVCEREHSFKSVCPGEDKVILNN